jgi:hypothetical protein
MNKLKNSIKSQDEQARELLGFMTGENDSNDINLVALSMAIKSVCAMNARGTLTIARELREDKTKYLVTRNSIANNAALLAKIESVDFGYEEQRLQVREVIYFAIMCKGFIDL